MKNLSHKEKLAYTAGFFDGEGCVNICCSKQKDRHGRQYLHHFLRIVIVNNDSETLETIKSYMEMGKIYISTRRVYGRISISYTYQITRQKETLEFLKLMYPYILTKKKEVKYVLKYWPKKSRLRAPVRRNKVYKKLRALKRRKTSYV